MFLFAFHHQGAIPQRGWAVREMGPRAFRSTSKTDLLYRRTTLRPVLRQNVFIGCDALFLFRWFEGFNWDGLCKGTLNPPVIPKVRHVQLGYNFLFCDNLVAVNRSTLPFVFQVKHPLDSNTCGHYTKGSVELCTNWDDFWQISCELDKDKPSGLVLMNDSLSVVLLPSGINYIFRLIIFSWYYSISNRRYCLINEPCCLLCWAQTVFDVECL